MIPNNLEAHFCLRVLSKVICASDILKALVLSCLVLISAMAYDSSNFQSKFYLSQRYAKIQVLDSNNSTINLALCSFKIDAQKNTICFTLR